MKHDLKISGELASQQDIRAHVPDPHQCEGCRNVDGDCSRLAFADMPLLAVHHDGIAFVDCLQFDRTPVRQETLDA